MIELPSLPNWLSTQRTVFWRNLSVRNAVTSPFLYGLHTRPKTNIEHGFYARLAIFILALIIPNGLGFSRKIDGASIWKNATLQPLKSQLSRGHLDNPPRLLAFASRKRDYTLPMQNEFTAVIEQDGEWYVGWSREIPGANGQGHTIEECRASLGESIRLILEDRREGSTNRSCHRT